MRLNSSVLIPNLAYARGIGGPPATLLVLPAVGSVVVFALGRSRGWWCSALPLRWARHLALWASILGMVLGAVFVSLWPSDMPLIEEYVGMVLGLVGIVWRVGPWSDRSSPMR